LNIPAKKGKTVFFNPLTLLYHFEIDYLLQHKTLFRWARGLTQQRASVRLRAVGALLRLDLLVLLGQAKRTKRKIIAKCLKGG
jgi:hypothetical protein